MAKDLSARWPQVSRLSPSYSPGYTLRMAMANCAHRRPIHHSTASSSFSTWCTAAWITFLCKHVTQGVCASAPPKQTVVLFVHWLEEKPQPATAKSMVRVGRITLKQRHSGTCSEPAARRSLQAGHRTKRPAVLFVGAVQTKIVHRGNH